MSAESPNQDLYGFALELRKLAYTMPPGCEDPLVRLSERTVHHALQQSAAAGRPRSRTGVAVARRGVALETERN